MSCNWIDACFLVSIGMAFGYAVGYGRAWLDWS